MNSQVDAGFISSDVWRLQLLHQYDDDADEEDKVDLWKTKLHYKIVFKKKKGGKKNTLSQRQTFFIFF